MAIVELSESTSLAPYTTAVSLHAHTNRSREGMTIVPSYLERIPLVALLTRREMRAYQRRHGTSVDFARGWWHPPVAAEGVLASECSQIRTGLGLRSMVSITDHDCIDAGLALLKTAPAAQVPLSCEWTLPFGRGFLHLGVHNLPRECGAEIFRTLAAYTQCPATKSLPDLLMRLHADRETLLVLNHPLWDLAGVGPTAHVSLVRKFLTEHGRTIHALELNGYRSWRENTGVIRLAGAFALPIVSGGDRHGRAPNSLLNLTTAASFGQFVREIRDERRSVILVMPEYRQPLLSRKLAVVSDAVREYPGYPLDQRRWADRISYEREGVTRRLSDHWPGGGPWWVRASIRIFEIATRRPLLPALRMLIWLAGASGSDHTGVAALIDAQVSVAASAVPYTEVIG